MASEGGAPSAPGLIALIALGLAVIGGGVYYAGLVPEFARPVTVPEVADKAGEGQETATAEPQADQPSETAQAPAQGDAAATTDQAETALAAPAFDVVRVEPDGTTLVAGTAPAGARVTFLLDEDEVGEAVADASGKFVSFLALETGGTARVLSMVAALGARESTSDEPIIVAPVQSQEQVANAAVEAPAETGETPAADAPAVGAAPVIGDAAGTSDATPAPSSDAEQVSEVAAPETPGAPAEGTAPVAAQESAAAPVAEQVAATEPAATAVTETVETTTSADASRATTQVPEAVTTAVTPAPAASATTVAAAPASTEAAPAQSAAPVAVLRATRDGVELLQPVSPEQPDAMASIALDTISYSDEGEVELTGRARGNSVVRVYLDNKAVADLDASAEGKWQGELTGVEPGVYTLRLDELNAKGDVLSRMETPFKREAPEVLNPPTSGDAPGQTALVRAVTVQKGDTLWAISRDRYGEGLLYVRVFEANRESIRDPDLIYPGQVFTLPE